MAHSHITDIKARWSKSPKHSKAEAVKWAQKAVKINASDAGTLTVLGNIYIVERQYEKAIAEIKKAIAIDPNYSIAYLYCSDAMYRSGRFEEAIEMAKKSIRLHGPFPNSGLLMFLGNSYHMAGHYEEALSVYKRLLDLSRKGKFSSKGAHLRLAAAYIRLGRDQEARDHVTEVLKNDPTYSMERVIKVTKGRFKDTKHLERYIDDYRLAGIPEHPPLPLPDKPSIAVLPFANISGDPKEDYLSDGITEQIITALSKTPRMLVIARNSVFTYKRKPVMVQQVSKELGVRYVLEGSVQRSGDRLRITAQLIDAKTGNHLWSERYDRDLTDLFDLQDDITRNIIMALQVKLTVGENARLLGKGTKNLEAYLKLIKGIHHYRRFNKNDNEIARRLYGEAIALDPNYSNAYAQLATIYHQEVIRRWTKTPEKSNEKATELAQKAISLDELNAVAYLVLAHIGVITGQFEKAMAAGKKGLSLDPANSLVNASFGIALYSAGKFKEAIPLIRKAIRIDPKHPSFYLSPLAWSYFFTGQNEETITIIKKWASREPSNADVHASLGCALIYGGKPEEAVAMFEKALSLNPDRPDWYVGNLAPARFGAGQPEEAITTLREVLSRNPENGEACLWLSATLTFEGKHEEALSMAKKAVSLNERGLNSASPASAFYWCLGISSHMMGQYEEAIAAFKKAISPWPDYVFGHVGLTASYSLAGRMEEAGAEAAEVLRINPKFSLEDIAKNGYFNYKRADKERFINALRKAGLK